MTIKITPALIKKYLEDKRLHKNGGDHSWYSLSYKLIGTSELAAIAVFLMDRYEDKHDNREMSWTQLEDAMLEEIALRESKLFKVLE
jgi:hypothetical protein